MGTFFVIVCGALAALFVLLAVTMGLRAGRTREWIAVEGRILASGIEIVLELGEGTPGDIDDYDRRYKPWVRYEYRVDGATLRGAQVAPDTVDVPTSDTWALRVVERYPAGNAVTVHHDPGVPARAVLEPGASRNTVGVICVMLVLAALCATIAVLIANDPPAIPAPDFKTPN